MSGRILITAPGSNSGKTTTVIALLDALIKRGIKPCSFKCGPDYIDPMYHRKTMGIPAYNLDPYFCDEDKLKAILSNGMRGRDIAIIEGVMGYYDGIGPKNSASTYEVADKTGTPVILVINAKGMSGSVAALIRGFLSYKTDSHIRGVIFNNVSKGMYPVLSEYARSEGVKPLGYIPYDESCILGSRHLGLITANEIDDINSKIDRLGSLADECLDIDGILALAAECTPIPEYVEELAEPKVRLAVARDMAFSFIYQENIDVLARKGCEIVYFSPLNDDRLPEDIDGLYIPGGYPEEYADRLSTNASMLRSVNEAIKGGMPAIAECGGFMYLHESIDGYPMAGVIPGSCVKKSRLVRFGYGYMEAKRDGLILKAGDGIRVHEFHYYDSDNAGEDLTVTKASNNTKYDCAYMTDTMYAGYPHIYLPANERVADNFIIKMNNYKRNR